MCFEKVNKNNYLPLSFISNVYGSKTYILLVCYYYYESLLNVLSKFHKKVNILNVYNKNGTALDLVQLYYNMIYIFCRLLKHG